MDCILKIERLKKYFYPKRFFLNKNYYIPIKAVDDISFEVKYGETFGIVGESGCGKSTLAKTIVRLYEPDDGRIIFDNVDITYSNDIELRKYRRFFQIIFQDPYTSLNPRMSIEEIISEPLIILKKNNIIKINKKEIRERVVNLIEKVGLSRFHLNRYPHEFSGGQRQRIGIARALIMNPKLIICDEPISALDVSIQAQILNLLIELQKENNLTYIFISHDLSVVKNFSERIAVMYLGKIIELATSEELYKKPLHPYSNALILNIPEPDPFIERNKNKILLRGEADIKSLRGGCRFIDRCPISTELCKKLEPLLTEVKENHFTACHNYKYYL